jgi:hypothetical protein
MPRREKGDSSTDYRNFETEQFQKDINGHPQSGWLGFSAIGRKDKRHTGASTVAPLRPRA